MMIRKCFFKDDWMVTIIKKDDMLYDSLKPMFEQYGVAFADLSNNFIYIDGEVKMTENHILAIEAHEIGHYLLDHKGLINKSLEAMEMEADWAGSQILKKYEKTQARSIIDDRFEETYGVLISDYSINPKQRQKIQKYLNEIKNI